MMKDEELAIGQVWQDDDPREKGHRLVEILGFDDRYVYLKTIQLAPYRWQRALGRNTRVLRSRFKPGGRGFSFVRHAIKEKQ